MRTGEGKGIQEQRLTDICRREKKVMVIECNCMDQKQRQGQSWTREWKRKEYLVVKAMALKYPWKERSPIRPDQGFGHAKPD